MWFSGKKYKRVRCENIDELLASTNASEEIERVLKMKAPVICYTALDDNRLKLDLEIDGKHIFSHVVGLGKEEEMEKRDGSKVRMTYTLEGDNILKQVIKMSNGKTAYFTREFKEGEIKMVYHLIYDMWSVTMDGSDVTAAIYYEILQ